VRSELLTGIGLLLSLAGCNRGDATGVEVRIDPAPGAPVPERLELDWLDGDGFVFRDRPVPAKGLLPAGASPLAVVRIAITGAPPDRVRRVTVRGFVGEQIVVEGAARGGYLPGSWVPLPVRLEGGRLLDGDDDHVPDTIDDCPGDPTRSGGECAETDAGAPDGGAPDGGPDLAEGGADGPQDLGVESPVQGPSDASADLTPPLDGPPGPEAGRDAGGGDARFDVPVVDPQKFACGKALLVSASMNEPGDKPLVGRLTALGCALTVTSDGTFGAGDATGMAVVVVSDSVAQANVRTTLRALAVPVVLMRADLFDDSGLTGPADGTDWSHDSNEGLMVMVGAGHPLAAGLGGTIAFTTKVRPVGWGHPAAGAVDIGVTASNAARSLLFGYEAGAVMSGSVVAPARRVGYPIHVEGLAELNGNGWALFDASVKWAAGQ
jgi:hypothetical protein